MPIKDFFLSFNDSPMAPARRASPVTKSDTDDLTIVPKRIYVGTGGNVVLIPAEGGDPVTYKNVANGVYLNVRPKRILATGTTASDIVAEG